MARTALLYDNASTAYSLAELQAALAAEAGDIPALAISWPFPYGPQGGKAGAVDGVETEWDSDFCQTGSLQHARFRFLRRAASVLNVDIDELVLSDRDRSIFEATEQSRTGLVKFPGLWIGTHTPHATSRETCRHADFACRDLPDEPVCPPKWCLVPGRADRRRDTWSVHNLFGARANRSLNDEFTYRHMRGISDCCKEERWAPTAADPASLPHDEALAAAFQLAGMERGSEAAPPTIRSATA